MKKLLLIVLPLFSSIAFAKHDSTIDFRGLQDECEQYTADAARDLSSARIAYVINTSCDYIENSTTTMEARFTMIDAKLVATAYDVTGASNKCDQNMQASLQALHNAGKVAFINHACDFTDNSSTIRTGSITVISEYETQLISR
jgi:hypothetical protein